MKLAAPKRALATAARPARACCHLPDCFDESSLAVDKADIFHEITRRNALRRAAQMPLLNVRRELDRLVALKALEEYYELREARYADN